MSLKDLISSANDILKTYHTVSQNITSLERDIKDLTTEFREIRIDHIRLEGRVARLEESRETIKAEMRANLAESLAKHESEFIRAQARLEIEYAKAAAELYKKYLDSRSLPAAPPASTLPEAKNT